MFRIHLLLFIYTIRLRKKDAQKPSYFSNTSIKYVKQLEKDFWLKE